MFWSRPQIGKGMSTTKSAAPRTFWPTMVLAALVAGVQRAATNLWQSIVVVVRAPRVPLPRIPAIAFVTVAVTVAVIVAAMFLVDAAASDWALNLPRWFIDLADEITNFGLSGRFLYPFGLTVLILCALIAPRLPSMTQGVLSALVARFGFLFLAIALPSLFDTIVKRMIGRARPYIGPHDDPFFYKPFAWVPNYSSMPSGHATTAAAAAIAIGAVWPASRPVMWLYALVIMFTRVVINVHHPSDVLAGALVGVVGALMVRRWFAARRLVFVADDLQAFPWPSWRRLIGVGRQLAGTAASSA
jgi:membrane-associated phospholipid phosphatase